MAKSIKPTKNQDEQGFITLIIAMLVVIGVVVFFAFLRVHGAQR